MNMKKYKNNYSVECIGRRVEIVDETEDAILYDVSGCRLENNRTEFYLAILSGKVIMIYSSSANIEDVVAEESEFEDFLFYLTNLNVVYKPSKYTWRLRPEYKQGFYIPDTEKPRTA